MRHVLAIVEVVAAVGSAASIAYYLLCLYSARSFLRHTRAVVVERSATPPISVLKPLKGTDPQMHECFRSHCLQEYPEYELIFGVSEANDPAIDLVERLRKEFPDRSIQSIVCNQVLGTNTKVSNLAQMLPCAKYDLLLVNDSDIAVPPDYLKTVGGALADPKVGLVTCLYRAEPSATFGSRLESLGISTDFVPGVLVARQLEGMSFGLGSTLAFPRGALEEIGGFTPLADYLADDYELGNRIAHTGRKVELLPTVVKTHLPAYTFGKFLRHQMRWARTIRSARGKGYLGLVFTFGVPWALLAVVGSAAAGWSWLLLGVVAALRTAFALYVGRNVLNDSRVVFSLWMLPVRDLVGAAVWLASFFGNTIEWRGERFKVEDGKLAPLRRS